MCKLFSFCWRITWILIWVFLKKRILYFEIVGFFTLSFFQGTTSGFTLSYVKTSFAEAQKKYVRYCTMRLRILLQGTSTPPPHHQLSFYKDKFLSLMKSLEVCGQCLKSQVMGGGPQLTFSKGLGQGYQQNQNKPCEMANMSE